ncbi:Hypothetical protein PHPALM_37489 [Phytophthora palmivora]|uniref:EF-hand domain-containing protein n=1 Tax=Phytophthora palmivora TaxID=4796 RepID=A0A2P4WXA4_9STRA|nr:Hypothetical protein PHPALM_37489 [Phytophthora palmivora]
MVDAHESQHAVTALLSQWTACGRLTYKFYVTASASGRDGKPRMVATFSKPTAQTPAPEAVARLYFHLSADHQRVHGFTVEQDPHYHDLEIVKFDEAILDRVIRRKLQLQVARLIDLSDEFASTRVPAVMRAREEEQREHERETMEEYLLEQMQHSDSYNDDRDDMMAYGDFVSVAADMIDSMSGAGGETTQSADEEDVAIDAFEVVTARQTHYTVEKLVALLDAHAERVTEAAKAMAARRAEAEFEAKQEATNTILEETNEGENEEEEGIIPDATTSADEALNDAVEDDAITSRRQSSASHRDSVDKKYPRMNRYQLRALLETPQLLLSEAEINLTLALAETTTNPNGVEEVLCEKLAPLLRRVRRMIFRFQRKGFVDRTETYLLHQFQAFERRNLQGASKHLKQRLTQKEVKGALKHMQKLLLSPYQLMQLSALSEDMPGAPDHGVYYQEIIPRLVQCLQDMVNVDTIADKSAILHEMGVWDFAKVGLPSEDIVRQTSFECFASFDKTQSGVISTGDFRDALKLLSQMQDFPVGMMTDIKQLSALADPNNNGRVNYALFQHLMYPLLLFLWQERELSAAKDGARNRCAEKRVGMN